MLFVLIRKGSQTVGDVFEWEKEGRIETVSLGGVAKISQDLHKDPGKGHHSAFCTTFSSH